MTSFLRPLNHQGYATEAKLAQEVQIAEDLNNQLFLAALNNDLEGFKNLLKQDGVSIIVAEKSDKNLRFLKVILNKSPINQELAIFVVENGAKVKWENDGRGTPLFIAASNNLEDLAACLLQRGAELDQEYLGNRSPLHAAAWHGGLGIVQLLLKHSAEIDLVCADGTPLSIAANNGHFDVVQCLVKFGADVNKTDLRGEASLHHAAVSASNHKPEKQRTQLELVKCLIASNAEIDLANNLGETPFFLATRCGHLETGQVLLDNGAKVDRLDTKGISPVYCAAQRGEMDTMKFLMENGADITMVGPKGRTLLHAACQFNKLNVAKFLRNCGADMHQQDSEGKTPWDLVPKHLRAAAIEILEYNPNI